LASVSLQHLYKVFAGNVAAVSDFTIDIEDREFIVLVGPSGCGKSTTLRMIAGLEEITDGELYIGDKLMNETPPKERDIAMVFQSYALYPHMTVYDNMAFGLKLRKTPKAEIDRRVKEAARILDIEHLLNRKPKALSGGQRQRVALGRAIVREPKVFLMDEPLSNLDAKLRVQMRTEITKLHNRLQSTFIYVTHDQTEAMTMGSRIVVMREGFIQQVDTPQNLYDYPANEFVASFIGTPQMNFIEVTLKKNGNEVYALFGDNKIKVPAEKVAKFKDPDVDGKEVLMGIRPENLSDDAEMLQKHMDEVFTAKVEVVELMGSETYLYLSIDGKEDNIIARVDPRSVSRQGDTVKIAMEGERLHFFDKETELTLMDR
jgi:multiple sugar transport system ATP-binding protein